MQLHARLALLLKIIVVSVVLGAVFGHIDAASSGGSPSSGYLRGAIIGAIISASLGAIELFVLSAPWAAPFNRMPFLLHLSARSAIYAVVVLLGLAIGFAVLPAHGVDNIRNLVFSMLVSVAFNLFFAVNRLLGQNVLFNFAAGRYHRPRIEDRVLLFIDMESSTLIAERLGEVRFLVFLNLFVRDLTDAIVGEGGEIHKYVGDEVIATWKLAAGVRDARCVRACFNALERLAQRGADYERAFGLRANFRAGLHCGPVVVGELGSVKMEIALLGDTVNTAARIQDACRQSGHRVLASAALIGRIAELPNGIVKRSLGQTRLRGKGSDVELYALETRSAASPEVSALPPADRRAAGS